MGSAQLRSVDKFVLVMNSQSNHLDAARPHQCEDDDHTQPTQNTGKLRGRHIETLTFASTLLLPLTSNAILVLVGPNNAGKTQSLSDSEALSKRGAIDANDVKAVVDVAFSEFARDTAKEFAPIAVR